MRTIEWSRAVDRDLRRLDRQTEERIVAAVTQLAESGYGDILPLTGRPGWWRLRVGNWRVLYTQDLNVVRVIRVLLRDQAHRP